MLAVVRRLPPATKKFFRPSLATTGDQLCGVVASRSHDQSNLVPRRSNISSRSSNTMSELDQYYECVLSLVNEGGKVSFFKRIKKSLGFINAKVSIHGRLLLKEQVYSLKQVVYHRLLALFIDF